MMCAYNSVNGDPPARTRFCSSGHCAARGASDGYVVSDCGAIRDIRQSHKFVPTQEEAAAVPKTGTDLDCGLRRDPRHTSRP